MFYILAPILLYPFRPRLAKQGTYGRSAICTDWMQTPELFNVHSLKGKHTDTLGLKLSPET